MDIKQILLDQLSGAATEKLGSQNGLDANQTNSTVNAALTAILSGLQQEASSSKGAEQLDAAVTKKHNGSILADLAEAVGNGANKADGGKILEHIFGNKAEKVTDTVAENAGVSSSAAGDILATLAPIVLGQLGQKKQSEGLDVSGLASILLGQKWARVTVALVMLFQACSAKRTRGSLCCCLGS